MTEVAGAEVAQGQEVGMVTHQDIYSISMAKSGVGPFVSWLPGVQVYLCLCFCWYNAYQWSSFDRARISMIPGHMPVCVSACMEGGIYQMGPFQS